MDIDRPLDELIKSKKVAKRASAPRGTGGAGNKPKQAGGARDRYAGNAPRSASARAPAPVPQQARGGVPSNLAAEATKIIISNLPTDVNEASVRDLLQSTVGPVRSVHMSYNSAGRSTGTATVIFKDKGSAAKAHAAYNNRMIDNQRPMKVEIALDMNQIQSLASRVAPAPAAQAPRGGAAAGGARGAGPKGGRAAGGRGGAGAKKDKPKPKTAEDLDAEMNAYKDKTAA